MIGLRWSVAPSGVSPVRRRNYLNAQRESALIGVASGATIFLPVFLARLGATNLQVGLLSALPALTGLALAIVVGQHLQRRRNVLLWYARSRLVYHVAYAATGLVPFLLPREWIVPGILAVWAAATVPGTVFTVAFPIVMDGIAGPRGRYDLLSRRWAVIGLFSAISAALAGQVLERLDFPFGYQLVFVVLGIAGLASFEFASRLVVPELEPPGPTGGLSRVERARALVAGVRANHAFVWFAVRHLVYSFGTRMALPLVPLYYVHEVRASDAWIGLIGTGQAAAVLLGFYIWRRQERSRGHRFVLLVVTATAAFYPALLSLTHAVVLVFAVTAAAAVFQAGVELALFDELMGRIPRETAPTFVSVDQTAQHLAGVAAPIAGALVADLVGLGGALVAASAVGLAGFLLFARYRPRP